MMADDARILALVEEVIDSDLPAEEVCAQEPELLADVKACLNECRNVRSLIDDLFPEAPREAPCEQAQTGKRLPSIPGYQVLGVLGRGGIGIIYRARQFKLDRVVALKMLLSGEFAGPSELARFMREARAVAALQHTNIVQIYEVGDVDGRPFFTMELAGGGSLSRKLAGAPQPVQDCASVTETLARAVHFAHLAAIVHRDIKPGNILIATDGTLKLSDFGLARQFERAADITRDAAKIGTPGYMAPEQVIGKPGSVGPLADIYALGATLYEMLTGRPPFRGETAADTERQLLSLELVPPSKLNARVPRDLETICLKCLRKEPQHRYATALELAEDLARYRRGEPITARPVSRFERGVRWGRRNPTAAALILTTVGLLVLGALAGASKWRLQMQRRAEIAKWTPRLELMDQLERKGQYQEARALLERRPDTDVGVLSDRIHRALTELDLAQTFDQIRLNRVAVVNGRFDLESNRARSDRDYESAFGEAGLGGLKDTPSVVAAGIRASPLRTTLVAALDDWVVCTNNATRRGWVFDVARDADPDPVKWRDSVRDPALSGEALAKLADSAVVPDQSAQLLVALGQRMQAAGVDPANFLERVQHQYPGDFWACFTLAEALWDKKPEECIRYYQAALAIRPETAVAHHNVGRALANAGRVDEAIAHFREAVRLEPKFAHALGNLGMVLSMKDDNAEALDLVKRAVALDDRSAREHMHLADVLNRMGHPTEAIDQARRAIALDPNFMMALCDLGFYLMHLNRGDEAMEQFQCAVRIDPESAWPHLMIGQLLHYEKRYDEAIAELQTAGRLNPRLYGVYALLGDCWRDKQSPQNALLEYDKALALRPDDAGYIQKRRAVMLQLGLGEAVRAEWKSALKAGPPTHDAWYGYAELCLYLGHQHEYERACHELLDRFESSDDPQVCERTGRACLLGIVGSQDAKRAAALIERAVSADPMRSPAWAHPYFRLAQGLARYRLGDFDGVVRVIRGDVLTAHGPFPYLVLAMAHRRAGRPDEAFRCYAAAMRVYDWGPSRVDSQDAWLYHILRREAEPLVLPNLTALLAGQDAPRSQDEQIALAYVCRASQRMAMAAELFEQAFDADPGLANRREPAHRYYAARCAAEAGCGIGEDAAELTSENRAKWRERARVWLRDELAARQALRLRASTAPSSTLPSDLASWFTDPALACVRDEAELSKLSSAEREAWRELWRGAELLLNESRSATTNPSA